MDENTFVSLLENWIKEMKSEIDKVKDCGHNLKTEINNLKNETNNLKSLTQTINTLKTEITIDLKELKNNISKKNAEYDLRLVDLEKKDLTLISENTADKNDINLKLESVKDKNKTLSNQLSWIWRSILALSIGVIYKFLQS